MKTPQQSYPALAEALGLTSEAYLKREDLHHYGSHKGRSIPKMIELYVKAGTRNFVISSSGNAALAAILAVQAHNRNTAGEQRLQLAVFVGNKIPTEKLSALQNVIEGGSVTIKQVENPKQRAFQMDKAGTAKFLRQSTDDNALLGYEELAMELSRIPDLSAVFVPTSSGTTAQALGEYFLKNNLPIQVHIVQTTFCHPIAGEFAQSEASETSLALAIVDNVAHRKTKVVDAIKNSGGSGWIVTDDEIKSAMKLVEETANIVISPNSALSVAGLKKAVSNGLKWNGPVACLITGS